MKKNELIELLKTTKRNLIVMVGPPASGKSTFINSISEYLDDTISSDDLVMELGGGLSYKESYRQANFKNIRHLIREKINDTCDEDLNISIDMMNVSVKSRKVFIKKYKTFNKIAVITKVEDKKVLLERNERRSIEEDKFIPEHVIDTMLSKYKAPTREEGFDHIVRL